MISISDIADVKLLATVRHAASRPPRLAGMARRAARAAFSGAIVNPVGALKIELHSLNQAGSLTRL
jgi:hypothetical protein